MHHVAKSRSPRQRALRAIAAAAHLVLALAVLFGIVHSGGRYFYCEALGLLPTDPCSGGVSHAPGPGALTLLAAEASTGVASEHHVDCCEIVTLATMPRAARAEGPRVAPAALVAVLPADGFAGRAGRAGIPSPSRVDRAFERWRPPPRASNEVHAQLMVFRI